MSVCSTLSFQAQSILFGALTVNDTYIHKHNYTIEMFYTCTDFINKHQEKI